jgi:hypothetical protein
MPEQPLSRVNPKASVSIGNAGHRALSERPALAVLAMEALGSWANVELFLLSLFVKLLGGNEALASKLYLVLDGQRSKSQVLAEAVKTIEDHRHGELVQAVIGISRTNEKVRDRLAHHVWGISPDLLDALLLIDPKTLVGPAAMSYDDVFVYRANDFQQIIAANDRLCGYGLKLNFILTGHVANRDGRLYNELCSQPEIRERLDRPA